MNYHTFTKKKCTVTLPLLHQEKFEDTKGVIRSLELKDKILVTVMVNSYPTIHFGYSVTAVE
jgi:hypothetical protein